MVIHMKRNVVGASTKHTSLDTLLESSMELTSKFDCLGLWPTPLYPKKYVTASRSQKI